MAASLVCDKQLDIDCACGVLIGSSLAKGKNFAVAFAPAPSADLVTELATEVESLLPGGLRAIGVFGTADADGFDGLVCDVKSGRIVGATKEGKSIKVTREDVQYFRMNLRAPTELRDVSAVYLHNTHPHAERYIYRSDNLLENIPAELTGWLMSSSTASTTVDVPLCFANSGEFVCNDVMAAVDMALSRTRSGAADNDTNLVEPIRIDVGRAYDLCLWISSDKPPATKEIKSIVGDLMGISIKATAIKYQRFSAEGQEAASKERAAEPVGVKASNNGSMMDSNFVGPVAIALVAILFLAISSITS